MSIWYKKDLSLEDLTLRNKKTMSDFLDIEFIEIGEDYITAKMPVDDRTRQPVGIMHGGASCVLAETVGSIAANFCVDLAKYYCVGLDINTNHIRSIREGFVYATAKPFHIGRTTHVWGINIVNDQQQMISVNRLTMTVLTRT
jgi:1,4-dihydroxy-2-naphthoyl-CoA hydrolase